MNFIKLTSTLGKEVWVNADYIVMIGKINPKKAETEFSVVNADATYKVKETPEEIVNMILKKGDQ